jgi:hypothetical protein
MTPNRVLLPALADDSPAGLALLSKTGVVV